MKKCMICGWEDSDDSKFTCPACGEASWAPGQPVVEFVVEPVVEPVLEPVVEPVAAPKRGPGRPRKS